MDCRESRERLSDYQDGTLPFAVAAELSDHLRACGGCEEVARTLASVRDHLRDLPPLPAPPELLARIRETVAREAEATAPAAPVPPAPRFASGLKIPLQAAAVVVLFASVYWYQTHSVPPAVPKTTVTPPGIVSSGSAPAPGRAATPAPKAVPSRKAGPSASPERGARRVGISTLPPDTPEPRVRVWSQADLPAAPALRAATDAERVVPGFPTAHELRRKPLSAGEREVLLDVSKEQRGGAEERIADAAVRLGGSVEGTDRVATGFDVTVHVLVPETAAPAFLERLSRIGTIPREGVLAESRLPEGEGTEPVAYTVKLRVR